jgi:hypothetical protein
MLALRVLLVLVHLLGKSFAHQALARKEKRQAPDRQTSIGATRGLPFNNVQAHNASFIENIDAQGLTSCPITTAPQQVNGQPVCDCPTTNNGVDLLYGFKLHDPRCRLDSDGLGELTCLACQGCCESTSGSLCVRIIRGTNLPDTDGLGAAASDAYVKVEAGSTMKQTPHIAQNMNPEWTWEDCFDVDGSVFNLDISVWDFGQWLEFWWDGHEHVHSERVNFRDNAIVSGEWTQFTTRLEGGVVNANGEASIDYEVKWNPTPP